MTVNAGRAAGAAALPVRFAFLGLGLIGGSIAIALRDAGARASLVAWSPAGRGPVAAVKRGIVDVAIGSAEAAVDGAGLVILAGPPLAILEALGSLGGPWRSALADSATVTDVGSTKESIVAAADAASVRFVGGHPMAGRETAGVESAIAGLFVDRRWVVPGASSNEDDVACVEALAVATGARPIRLDAHEHDRAVAAISHLPLVVSVALVEAVAGDDDWFDASDVWPIARRLAAGGWTDMTRLARGDPAMGAGILATNAGATSAMLRRLRDVVVAWIDQLDAAEQGQTYPVRENRRFDATDPHRLRLRLEQARAQLADQS